MLTHLHIKNFVIIEELEVEFLSGFSILTGETGAGKSILIDALELALGERADTNVIRQGSDRCEISLNFDLNNIPAAKQWLQENELASEQDCILRRTIGTDGRSRSFINGIACPLQSIRELSNLLVNIHGQHEHQALLKKEKQRSLLDNFANHTDLCQQVERTYQQWRQAKNELEQLIGNSKNRSERMELLRFQAQELHDLDLGENELAELEQEHKKLANAAQIISSCNSALDVLARSDNDVHSQLHLAMRQLENCKDFDKKINSALELLNQAVIQTEEAGSELQHYLDSLEINGDRLQWIDERLSLIYQLARKYRIQPKELTGFAKNLKTELEQLEHADEFVAKLQQKIATLEKDYREIAKKLSASREKAAKKLAKAVTIKMQELSMQGGKFDIGFESLNELSAYGLEKIEFLVSANQGQALQPLNKVASGGELSRIGLAIQVITAQKDDTPTLIFDEVDVGIGGGVAEIIGKLLRALGEKAQVMCITHLPQVAAQGHQHMQVKKMPVKNAIQTHLQLLNHEERVAEIARMLGGVKITQQTLAHAKEMVLAN